MPVRKMSPPELVDAATVNTDQLCKECHFDARQAPPASEWSLDGDDIYCPNCWDRLEKEQLESQGDTYSECPKCKQPAGYRISLLSKVGSVALLGVLSVFAIGHVVKTFKCSRCGFKW